MKSITRSRRTMIHFTALFGALRRLRVGAVLGLLALLLTLVILRLGLDVLGAVLVHGGLVRNQFNEAPAPIGSLGLRRNRRFEDHLARVVLRVVATLGGLGSGYLQQE